MLPIDWKQDDYLNGEVKTMAVKVTDVARNWGGSEHYPPAKGETPRQQEHLAEAVEFLKQYLTNDVGSEAVFNIKYLEDSLGLENGTLLPLLETMRTSICSKGACGTQGALTSMFILGMWAMENKYQHLETKTLVTS